MFQARLELNPEYYLYYVVEEGGKDVAAGGLTKQFVIKNEYGNYQELILRATINLIMDGPFDDVYADGSFGFDLTPYGFTPCGELYKSHKNLLRLPHFCGGKH